MVQTMNRKNFYPSSSLFRRIGLKKMRLNFQVLALLFTAFTVLSLGTCVSLVGESGFSRINLADFKVGTVSDRDVVLARNLSYIDEEATAIRREARLNLVTAVFAYEADSGLHSRFFDFVQYLEELRRNSSSPRVNALEVQESYPGAVDPSLLEAFFALPGRTQAEILRFATSFFNSVVTRGLTSFPDEGMENFSSTEVEVVRGTEHSTVEKSSLLTRENLGAFLHEEAQAAGLDESSQEFVLPFLTPFLRDNLVYQSEESERKRTIAMESVSPVLVVIPQGEKIIRRGFVITEENRKQLEHFVESGSKINMTRFVATELTLLAVLFVSVFMLSVVPCKNLQFLRYRIFLAGCFCLLYVICLIFTHIHELQRPMQFMLLLPTAFFSMLIAILLNKPVAVVMVFSLSAAVFLASGFMPEPVLFSVLSGLAAVFAVRDTGRRLDLVRSSGLLYLFCALAAFLVSLLYPAPFSRIPFYTVAAAVNGFLSGILVIGFLPLLEKLLNGVTSFRLMELSDLNTPLMQKMLLTVPGTYNHSQMVASLAENACRAIGANSLLARVGAYYHDIGKMDQGEYFVENQHGENKHTELSPRLSATIIRSHVKQGIEKARNLKLPQEVIDIIAEHHGNSVISYFYNKEKMENPDTDPEDFMYPGNPPRTKESAVVMLADTVEAACRSLEKPSAPRLEKFIDELVKAKIEHGQLKDCDLTFHDLGLIKETFVSILTGYYHSRIEYPNQKDPDGAGKPAAKSKEGADALPESRRDAVPAQPLSVPADAGKKPGKTGDPEILPAAKPVSVRKRKSPAAKKTPARDKNG